MRTLVFDTETTGLTLHPSAAMIYQPHITEFASIAIENGEIVEECETKINPGQGLSAEIMKITGLTDDDLKDAPRFPVALPIIRGAFKGATLLIAHNLPFDRAILRYELARAGVTDFKWPRWELCTSVHFGLVFGRPMRMKEVYEQTFGEPLDQKHRALDDTAALARIVIAHRLWESYE